MDPLARFSDEQHPAQAKAPTRVLLADDHAILRAGLRALLEAMPDIEVVAEASTGEEAVEQAIRMRPDVVLMDLSMPGVGGLEATRLVAEQCPNTRILILTAHAEEEYLMQVLQAGGSGYVGKQSADEKLVEAIRTVAAGELFVDSSAAQTLVQSFRSQLCAATLQDPLDLLSCRELEVLNLTAQGYSASEIGGQLQISSKTVDTYRHRFMEKLKLRHRSELVRFAIRRGLLGVAE